MSEKRFKSLRKHLKFSQLHNIDEEEEEESEDEDNVNTWVRHYGYSVDFFNKQAKLFWKFGKYCVIDESNISQNYVSHQTHFFSKK